MEAPKREPIDRREPAERKEPVERREPVERGRFEPRTVEDREHGTLSPALRRDVTRWGPIFGGLVATIATAAVLSVLGAALGLSTTGAAAADGLTTAGAIWGGIVLLVSFFVGGYVAARTSAPGGMLFAVVNSSLVWAASLVFGILLAAIGLGSIVGLLGVSVPNLFAPATGAATAPAIGTMWAAFIGMIVALVAAVVGGLVGMHRDVDSYGYQ